VTLLQSGNTLTGNILDDGNLGEATLTGEVIGRRITFVKRYVTGAHHSISYTGTVSESEDFMQGQWSISGVDSGSWEARRSGENLTAELQTRIAKRVPVSVGGDI
jgi:hypothetical protein